MGLLNLLKSKQAKYDEQVGKMDSKRVFGLLDLMSPDMKKMLLAQINGMDSGLSKEQKESNTKLLEKAKNIPATDKLDLLTTDHLSTLQEGKEKVDACSYLQTRWKELEEHYGKKITDKIPASIQIAFSFGKDFSCSDLSNAAKQKDNIALMGAIAYCVLLDAHNNGQKDVAFCCENSVRVDNKMGNRNEKNYQMSLKSLDRERQFDEKRTATRNASIKAALDGR